MRHVKQDFIHLNTQTSYTKWLIESNTRNPFTGRGTTVDERIAVTKRYEEWDRQYTQAANPTISADEWRAGIAVELAEEIA